MNNFIIVSYYTLGTPYQEVAHKYLMNSLSVLNIKSDVRGVPNLGSWQKNTSFKATFIAKMMGKHSENIIFLDCDAELLSYPTLFDNLPLEYNFAAHILDRNKWYNRNSSILDFELLTGTLFIRNCLHSKKIVEEWVDRCINSNLWEQKVFHNIIQRYNETIYNLPLGYCYIDSLPNGDKPFIKCEKPIIIHHQVSRKFKKLIK